MKKKNDTDSIFNPKNKELIQLSQTINKYTEAEIK
jgi:hypothetical protein